MVSDKGQGVRRLLEALAVKPDRIGRIENATFSVIHSSALKGRYQSMVGDKHHQLVGIKMADAQLLKVARRITALRGAIADLSNQGVLQLSDALAIDEGLKGFLEALERARQQLLGGEITPPRRGRRPKPQPFYVAISALHAFEDLTGERATISNRPAKSTGETAQVNHGAYFELVRDLFKVFEIEAQAEDFAVIALRHHRDDALRKQKKQL